MPTHDLTRRLFLGSLGATLALPELRARAAHQRVVVTDHGLQGDSWGGLLPRLFDRFLAVSAFSARELRAPPERTRLIYGGADLRRFAPDPAVSRRGVLFVGRITPHKGIDRLIAALPPSAELSIAGSTGHDPAPPERNYPVLLRRLAEGRRVRFLGPVSEQALPDLCKDIRALVGEPRLERDARLFAQRHHLAVHIGGMVQRGRHVGLESERVGLADAQVRVGIHDVEGGESRPMHLGQVHRQSGGVFGGGGAVGGEQDALEHGSPP